MGLFNSVDNSTHRPYVMDRLSEVSDPLSVSMLNVMELLILSKTECFLNTSDNQFGFKKKHGTDMCIHAFRQTIEYYKQNSSPVCFGLCYLDVTKSFDRVNHWLLFKKLLDRKAGHRSNIASLRFRVSAATERRNHTQVDFLWIRVACGMTAPLREKGILDMIGLR